MSIKQNLGFYMAKMRYYIKRRDFEVLNEYYRHCGVKIGKNCLICTPLLYGVDGCLIEIGDDVVVSTNVTFVLHDYSASRVVKDIASLHGKVTIGSNSFIGARSVLMYGVEIGENTIVAAGSVVTKSFKQGNIIIGGNPANIIGTWDDFREKVIKNGHKGGELPEVLLKEKPETFITR